MAARSFLLPVVFALAIGVTLAGCGSDENGVASDTAAVTSNSPTTDPRGGIDPLGSNRDRLITDLAKRLGKDTCSFWSSLSENERSIFIMATKYFANGHSRIARPPSTDLTTALDHATSLYSINASDGKDCGGFDFNRIYLGFDDVGMAAIRGFRDLNPQHVAGYNAFELSDDPAGPHHPFTARGMIRWDWVFIQSTGPQWHYFATDADEPKARVDLHHTRSGVCGVVDPHLVEATIAFSWEHDSDPMCTYCDTGKPVATCAKGKLGTGAKLLQNREGGAAFDYTPVTCADSSPSNTDIHGGGTFNGRGPSWDPKANRCTK